MKSIMKKVLSMGLAVTLTAAVSITGTLAYLTDRDSKANVFTVGDVSIRLDEEFEQGATLIPGVKIEKEATITNTGDNDAYVWMTIAMPKAFVGEDAASNLIHWNIPGAFWNGYHTKQTYIDKAIANGYLPESSTGVDESDTWIVGDEVAPEQYVNIDGIKYAVTTILYTGAIESGETTNLGISTIYLDAEVDIDPDGNMYEVINGEATAIGWNVSKNGSPVVYVSAYAIQKDGFATVQDAYKAYNKQWTTTEGVNNGLEYGEPATLVSTAEELKAALEAGEPVALTSDIELTETIRLSGKGMTINGNDHKITTTNSAFFYTINGGNIEITDATLEGPAYIIYNQGSNVTMTDVTIKATSNNNYALCLVGGGVVELNNCTVTGMNANVDVWFGDGRTVTINGGEYSSMLINCSKGAGVVSAGTLTVNGASIGKVVVGAYKADDGTITRAVLINNGTITSTEYEDVVKNW